MYVCEMYLYYVNVHVYICMHVYVCMYVCMHVCMYVYVCVCVYVYVYVCMFMYVYTKKCVRFACARHKLPPPPTSVYFSIIQASTAEDLFKSDKQLRKKIEY